MKRILIGLVRIYQWGISPFMAAHCIHEPTCSRYMVEAIERFGVIKGLGLGIWRLLRCHPFARGGYDPVPDVEYSGNKNDRIDEGVSHNGTT